MSVVPSPTAIERLLIVMPTWLGDCVMATPTLRALRQLYPTAHIAVLAKASVRPVLDGIPWFDRVLCADDGGKHRQGGRSQHTFALARQLARERFDMAVLLPNSFRTALVASMAKIPHRVGYERDGRGFLLTDRLMPQRNAAGYVPVPTREYYLGLARYLGAAQPDPTMELFTRAQDETAADALFARAGIADVNAAKLVLINPGANFGSAKMWYPDRFAAVADRCARELGATVAVTGSPKERAILDQVLAAAREPMIDLPKLGLTLSTLKSVIRRAKLVITNDTGPRHLAAALDTPVVTIFGPTDPAWSEIGFAAERQVSVDVFCGPCQRKICPLDHRCMTRIDHDMVFREAAGLFSREAQRSA